MCQRVFLPILVVICGVLNRVVFIMTDGLCFSERRTVTVPAQEPHIFINEQIEQI